ncbi:hypothetical protein Hrd1104_02645 [Halorhabdus sp. CBA1104]|uniref:hypothetical protein n=1 Tax=unclassified Halorhabdus TaxID=2621901 RepID=UPI0012B3C841|nr:MULTISPECIES: hypothetical protein [unclassified Halorhabdus]QGN06297.1 hypothetical protein Hrd1104_02645 [Halorhabdus sp. CBA1104]
MWRRRDVLRSVGVASVAATPLLAGCLDEGLSGVMGTNTLSWVPSPETLGTIEQFNLLLMTPTALKRSNAVAPDVQNGFAASIARAVDVLGMSFTDLSGVYRIGHFAAVLEHTSTAERAAEKLRAAGFQATGEYDGYSLYVSPDESTHVAVSDEAILFGPGVVDGAGIVETVIDAKDGDRSRYRAVDDTFADLMKVLGDGDIIVGQTGGGRVPLTNVQATGAAWRFNEQLAKVTFGFVFPPGSNVPTDEIDRLATAGPLSEYDGVDVGHRGRVGVVTATISTLTQDTLTPLPALERAVRTTPAVRFEVTDGPDKRAATIVHAGGDAIPGTRLYLCGEGFRTDESLDQDEPGRWAGETSGSMGAVAPGDTVTVALEAGATVELTYHPVCERAGRTLATFEV